MKIVPDMHVKVTGPNIAGIQFPPIGTIARVQHNTTITGYEERRLIAFLNPNGETSSLHVDEGNLEYYPKVGDVLTNSLGNHAVVLADGLNDEGCMSIIFVGDTNRVSRVPSDLIFGRLEFEKVPYAQATPDEKKSPDTKYTTAQGVSVDWLWEDMAPGAMCYGYGGNMYAIVHKDGKPMYGDASQNLMVLRLGA